MKNFIYDTEDLIVALATPWAESALAIVRTSGDNSIIETNKIFSKDISGAESNTMHYGFLLDPVTGTKIDEVMVGVFRAPGGFTGQNSTEIYCHGSLPGIKAVIDAFKNLGFRDASPGEFTFRAFGSGKMDLTRAEAVQEIVSSKTAQAQNLALNRLAGGVTEEINRIKALILKTVSSIEIQLDYPEDEGGVATVPVEDVESAIESIDNLLKTYKTGRVYKDGIKIVLAGKTNAGKSSLFNLFLKEDRSIVSEVHGTTRDYLESWISMDGIPVRLYDTAGIREAEDIVEIEGIKRTRSIINEADIILYLVDGTEGYIEDREIAEKENTIILWNKIDIDGVNPPDSSYLGISTLSGEGFSLLEERIKSLVFKEGFTLHNDVAIDSERQKNLLDKCKEELNLFINNMNSGVPLDLVAQDIKEALDCLGEITGEVTSRDILENMFSSFCVGK